MGYYGLSFVIVWAEASDGTITESSIDESFRVYCDVLGIEEMCFVCDEDSIVEKIRPDVSDIALVERRYIEYRSIVFSVVLIPAISMVPYHSC